MKLPLSLAACLSLLPVAAAAQGVTGSPARPALRAIGCMISPDRVADIGSPAIGVVDRVKVELGDRVQAGQTLVLLRSDVERANVQVAQVRSAVEAGVRAAQAETALARQHLDRSVALEAQGFVSPQATEQVRAEYQVAAQKLELARGQFQVTASELHLARAQFDQRQVAAPFAGVVVERFVNEGERVEEKPLLRLARLDLLKVELIVPAQYFGRFAVNQAVQVQPELTNAPPRTARVTLIDPAIDPASNTFRVRLRLPNADGAVPGGARCQTALPDAGAGRIPARAEPALRMRAGAGTVALAMDLAPPAASRGGALRKPAL